MISSRIGNTAKDANGEHQRPSPQRNEKKAIDLDARVMTPVRWSRYSLAWRRQVGGSSALVLPHGGAPDIPPRLCLSLGSLAAALAVLVRHSRPLPAVFGLLLPSPFMGDYGWSMNSGTSQGSVAI